MSCKQSFQLHIGADLKLPTSSTRIRSGITIPMAAQPLEPTAAPRDYFDGLPLKAWAERLGERVMPTVELVREEHRRVKSAAAQLKAAAPEMAIPHVPHLLPFSRWYSPCSVDSRPCLSYSSQ